MGDFGDFIFKKRQDLDYTLRKEAKELGISYSYLSDLENGNKLPPNSNKEDKKKIMDKLRYVLKLSKEEYELMLSYADKELVDKGHISNDINEYMNKTPLATVALRKATNNNITNEEWKKIIKNIEKTEEKKEQ